MVNPIGSKDPTDFKVNVGNLDKAMNDQTSQSWTDRFGVDRITWFGIESKANDAINGLAFQIPVDYAAGLNVNANGFTVTYNGVVYAPQPSAVPFTTGAWDAAQWYPIQNVLNQKNLLVFGTYAEAQAAAATLPDGQVVDVEENETRYDVSNGVLTNQRPITPVTLSPVAGAATRSLQEWAHQGAVCVEDFEGVIPDADEVLGTGTDCTAGIRKAIAFAEFAGKALFVPGKYRVTEEIFIRKPIKIFGMGTGEGYSDQALTGYVMRSGFVMTGSGVKRLRTRVKARPDSSYTGDAPLSVALNVQADNCSFEDFTVYNWFDRTDNSPTNYGANWDVGLFIGTRVHTFMKNVHVVGYWREASIWSDCTRSSSMGEFSDPSGVPYESGTVKGSDGLTMIKVYTRGGKWGLRIQGPQTLDRAEERPENYYDEGVSGLVRDFRGSFGHSDFTALACSFYGPEHHSNYRVAQIDPALDWITDKGAGAVWIDGYGLSKFRFLSSRIASFEPFTLRIGRAALVQLFGSHTEGRGYTGRYNPDGSPVQEAQKYSTISTEERSFNVLLQGLSSGFEKTYLHPSSTVHDLWNGSSGEISDTFHTITAKRFQSRSGSLDIRAETSNDSVILRAGSNTIANLTTANGFNLASGYINLPASGSLRIASGDMDIRSGAGARVTLRLGSASHMWIESTAVRMTQDNVVSLGASGQRWTQVYAATGTINTSDAREKQQIRNLSDAERAVAVRLKSLIRVFKFNDAVESKGDKARIHVGVIAQDVKAAFESEGLVAEDYAVLCYDEWNDQPEVVETWDDEFDGDGNLIRPAGSVVTEARRPAGNRYGVRYEELLAFILAAI